MYTLSVNDRLSAAQDISKILRRIDADGRHEAEADPETVMETVRTDIPDAIFIDMEMPPFSRGKAIGGMRLASEIREFSPDANIIILANDKNYAFDALQLHVSGYILNPPAEKDLRKELSHLRRPPSYSRTDKLKIQCFGNFEVFHKGKAFKFSRSLSKEALAYLVDRRGAGCTVGEICAVLWEDRSADASLKSQCRVIMASLRKDLESIGAGDVIVKTWNTWSVDPTRIYCDYFIYMNNHDDSMFRGEYMSQYSWAELTMGSLINDKDEIRKPERPQIRDISHQQTRD